MDAEQLAVVQWAVLVLATAAAGVASGLAQERWWGRRQAGGHTPSTLPGAPQPLKRAAQSRSR